MSEHQFLLEMAERCFRLARQTGDEVAVSGLCIIGQAMLLRAQQCQEAALGDLDLEFADAAQSQR